MDFELTDDQVSLQEGVRAFLDGRFPLDAVRAIEAAGHLDRGRWQELGETGVFSIALSEAEGGLELGVSEAALVFEELGRALVPGPLVATFLAASWIDGAPAGETIVGQLEVHQRSFGRPSTRSPTMLRFTCDVPAAIVIEIA